MESHRIDGIKYNFERLTTDELQNIHGHLLAQHQRVTDEIGIVESALFARHHEELPFHTGKENYERVLGRAVLDGEISVVEATEALNHYDSEVA